MSISENATGGEKKPDTNVSENQENPQDVAAEIVEAVVEDTRDAEIADTTGAADDAAAIEVEDDVVKVTEPAEAAEAAEAAEPEAAEEPENGFETLGLPDKVIEAVKRVGFEQPSPIQAQTIPLLMEGRDVVGLAQTGTGKTAAFALPVLSQIDPKQRHPQALVLAPTRELALQVSDSFQSFADHLGGVNVLPIYGGQAYGIQLSGLRRGARKYDVTICGAGFAGSVLARQFAEVSGKRVLLVDMDAQGNATMGCGIDKSIVPVSTCDVLLGERDGVGQPDVAGADDGGADGIAHLNTLGSHSEIIGI